MKKFIAVILLAVLCVSFIASCGVKTSDVDKIKKAGKIIIGVTDYAPYDYQEGDTWVGFDADMARLVAKELGVEAEFIEIDWDNKIVELKSGKIDAIWNGMTCSDDLAKSMDFSKPYAANYQVIVIRKADAEIYKDVNSLKDKKIAVEGGSAGEDTAVAQFGEANVVPADGMTKALFEVMSNTCEAAIIDCSMAFALCGTGDYENLAIIDGAAFGEEQFAVGVRSGSDLTEIINKVITAAYNDGTMESYRLKYGPDAITLYDLSK